MTSQAGLPFQTEPLEFARSQPPAGFWIRVVATIVDGIVLSPLSVAGFALFSFKSLPLQLLLCIPGLVYKPLMESFYGATLGKMACGLRVIDERGERLSIVAAYLRFSPWLVQILINICSTAWLFSLPQVPGVQSVSDFIALGQVMQKSPFSLLATIASWVVLIDCVTAAFTDRKRAIHDMIAGSYCVRKVT